MGLKLTGPMLVAGLIALAGLGVDRALAQPANQRQAAPPRPTPPGLTEDVTGKPFLTTLAGGLLAALAIGAVGRPSKRGHQD